ncbi:MAG TPA: uroporphyrinogen decarboxylase family protein [Pseudolysinimonas sp.]|nr:uroporphyrinogen decarboxylase family protein [Pseudolysinimonas sp.]
MSAPGLPADHPLADGRTAAAPLIRAYRGDRPEHLPVRLPVRLTMREGTEPLEAALTPALAAELTLEPVRRHGVDAAIAFTHGLVPVKLSGLDLRIVPDRGPVLESPVRSASDVLRLRPLDPAALAPVVEAVGLAVAELGSTPLIGSAGAPFTLASFLVEGGPSRDHLRARAMMYADPHAWAALLNWCADVSGAFLRAQVLAGASAVQLVDPAIGALSRRDFQRRVAPHTQRAYAGLRGLDVPRAHVGAGSGDVLDLLPGIGAQVIGVDWRTPLDQADERLGGRVPVQGNLDPALLGAPWPTLAAHVADVLERGRAAPAHVLDVGHEVPADTDPGVLTRIVELAHGG